MKPPPEMKRTAQGMAGIRAIETRRPAAGRLFEDPYADAFLSRGMRMAASVAAWPGVHGAVQALRDRQLPGIWGNLLLRTRALDDLLEAALDAGAAQVVVLGAGCDTRALRVRGAEQSAFFEVDHPATQYWKRAQLEEARVQLPSNLHLVAVDFERDDLTLLQDAGFRNDLRTFWIWEGVSQYISPEACRSTVDFVAKQSAPGSRLAFTYVLRAVIEHDPEYAWIQPLLTRTAKQGEAWIHGLAPEEIPAFIGSMRLVDEWGPAEYQSRILEPIGRELRVSEVERLVVAEV